MRTPSRMMQPRSQPSRRALVIIWTVSAAAGLGLMWLATLPTVLWMASLLLAFWILARTSLKKQRNRLVSIAAGRKGESICHFARSLNTREVDTWVIRAVYVVLQQELEFAQPRFPVRASDDLEALLFDPDDLDMAVAPEVSRRAGRSLKDTETNPYYGKVRSVGDLVMFFNAQPKTREI